MTEDEIKEEIAEVKQAMKAIRLGGQSYTIGTGSSQRVVTMADYDKLKTHLDILNNDLAALQGTGKGAVIQAGW